MYDIIRDEWRVTEEMMEDPYPLNSEWDQKVHMDGNSVPYSDAPHYVNAGYSFNRLVAPKIYMEFLKGSSIF